MLKRPERRNVRRRRDERTPAGGRESSGRTRPAGVPPPRFSLKRAGETWAAVRGIPAARRRTLQMSSEIGRPPCRPATAPWCDFFASDVKLPYRTVFCPAMGPYARERGMFFPRVGVEFQNFGSPVLLCSAFLARKSVQGDAFRKGRSRRAASARSSPCSRRRRS